MVTFEPCEPDAFAEPLALSEAVEEALSLLSSFLEVAVGWSEDFGGDVLRGACEEEPESNALVSMVVGTCRVED